jgi:hypothetical protein
VQILYNDSPLQSNLCYFQIRRSIVLSGGAVVNTWQQLSDGPLLNTFGAIRSYCGLNSNPTVGQFVDALKNTIINAFALRGLCGTGCENGSVSVLDNLALGASSPNPSTNDGKETPDVPESFHVAQQVQKDMGAAVHAGDMEVFPVVHLYSEMSVWHQPISPMGGT